jgi:transketolase
VVSMPSWELFESQSRAYRDSILPPDLTARVAIEAGVPTGWDRYVGTEGEIIALNRFGASAPSGVLAKEWGFTADGVATRVRAYLERG